MFKHISKLFDYQELAGLMGRYERLQNEGHVTAATALRGQIADILSDSGSARSARD